MSKQLTDTLGFTAPTAFSIFSVGTRTLEEISLANTHWVVKEINGRSILNRTRITMEFTNDQVSGNASCNRYISSYTLHANQLSFGLTTATRLCCGKDAIIEQEALFLESLDKVETVSLNGNKMIITLIDGGELVLAQQKSIKRVQRNLFARV